MTLSRRAALTGAAVSVAALGAAAVPAIAAPDADAPLLALAAELIAIRQTWDDRAVGHEDDVAYDICNQPEEPLAQTIERQIIGTPVNTLRGFCVKVLIASTFGDFQLPDEVIAEAMALSGFLPERSHPMHPDHKLTA